MSESVSLRIEVRFHSGRTERFGPLMLGHAVTGRGESASVSLDASLPYQVTITPAAGERIASVEYLMRAPMANFESVIVPDSGRWFMNLQHVTAFWKFGRAAKSRIDDVKVPLYLFTGRDQSVVLAMGVIGDLLETDFRLLEPTSNRALNVHTRAVEVGIRRGTDEYPLTLTGELVEHLYVRSGGTPSRYGPWTSVLRDFSEAHRRIHGLADRLTPGALDPFWCSWTDWDSSQIGEDMVLRNVGAGLEAGIRNFIIDDGWFGPGLDSPYETALNIGDWKPDPAKFPDLPALAAKIGALGARAIIWCAPHAVGPAATCYPERAALLQADGSGAPVLGETRFYSLCFLCAQAREVMVEVCVRLARDYGFHGAKYDLFNWIPDVECRSPLHRHDIGSMLAGLRLVLAEADRRVREFAPGYIVELKQNYGTPALSMYGSCMRAGDAPYDPRSNFLRTLHIQAYTPFALNDYQTFDRGDGPEDVAVAALMMLAAGIPAYGADLTALPRDALAVLTWIHGLYRENRDAFTAYRTADDTAQTVLRAAGRERDLVFVLTPATACRISRPSLVFNAGYAREITVSAPSGFAYDVLTCAGRPLTTRQRQLGGSVAISVPPGGCVMFWREAGA
jgi:alpha-galactosidase